MPDPPEPDLVELRDRIRAADKAGHVATVALLCEEYVRHDRDDWLVWFDLGSALWGLARYRASLRALRKARELCHERNEYFVHTETGHLYKRWGKYRAAARCYARAIAARPDDATGYIYRGAALARLGELRQAEAMHRAATQCSAGCIDEAYLNLGLVLRGQGRSGEAAECFRKALELTPDYPEASDALADVEQVLALLDAV